MPELPEVETIRRQLEEFIINKTFARPQVLAPQSIESLSCAAFETALKGKTIRQVKRKGKYLAICLNEGILVVHLRMTGNLIFFTGAAPAQERFLRVLMPFTDGTALLFSDMRRFGRLWYAADQKELAEILKNVGPDLLDELSLQEFLKRLGPAKKRRLKALLLDQKFAAGLGNIYTDECLFRCGLHPNSPVSSLNAEEKTALYQAIQAVLKEGLKHGGTTFRDYRSAAGALGQFQQKLAVYNRAGKKCPRCGTLLVRTKIAGRGTCYCPFCQREKEL